MTRYVAFLRAINVGGHTIKMAELRALFAALGFAQVATFIASGNVIFESDSDQPPALEQMIEQHLHQSLGYKVATFLRTTDEVAAIAQYQPFPAAAAADTSTLYAAFLRAEPDAESQQRLLAFGNENNAFHIHGRELYWLCRTSSRASGFSGAVLEKTLDSPATLRNLNTIRRIAAKYA